MMTGYTYNAPQNGAEKSHSYWSDCSGGPTDFICHHNTPCSRKDMFSQIARINDHLYLSGLEALSPERLRQYGITQIVSAMIEPIPTRLVSAVSSHHRVPVDDIDYSNLKAHFDVVSDRIAREGRRGGKTVVHCMAGISRSATLVLAYLIKHQRMSLSEAYDHVRSRRPCIQPNLGFWRQLIAYEESRTGTRSMKITTDTTSNLTVPPSSSYLAGSLYYPNSHRYHY